MHTLLLDIAAPWAAWGYGSEFGDRRTLDRPTKSAIIGMLACALGWDRDHNLGELNALRYGVRTIDTGVRERDYHTAANRSERDGRGPKWAAGGTKVTTRWFISGGRWLVGLASDDDARLRMLAESLADPVFALFLGRKSYPVNPDLVLGIRPVDLADALEDPSGGFTWSAPGAHPPTIDHATELYIEDGKGTAKLADTPESFSMEDRRYSGTTYSRTVIDPYSPMAFANGGNHVSH